MRILGILGFEDDLFQRFAIRRWNETGKLTDEIEFLGFDDQLLEGFDVGILDVLGEE
jgi:hypothetical protein